LARRTNRERGVDPFLPPLPLPTVTQADKLVTLTKAANVEVEPIWASLLAKALEGKDVKELLTNVGAGGAPAAAGAAAGGAASGDAAPEAAAEKAEEEKCVFHSFPFTRSRNEVLTVFFLSLSPRRLHLFLPPLDLLLTPFLTSREESDDDMGFGLFD
jgi:ribosomal protein L12E/L44/L45/RPP1/RPP2